MIENSCFDSFSQSPLKINKLIPVVSVDLEKAFDSAARRKTISPLTSYLRTETRIFLLVTKNISNDNGFK